MLDSAGSVASGMGSILGDVFDWALDNIGDIASTVSGWFSGGGGGGGGGGWGSIISTGIDIIAGWFGFAKGAAFEGGNIVKRYAQGDVVTGPTTFSMGGGDRGLMGEAGPEAVMPLTRTSNGDLGVKAISDPNAMGGTNVNVNFTINAIDSTSVKDMLIGNQTTITNIIRNAVQDRGAQQAIGVAY
jgi:phage-related minor tail protein